MKCPDEIADAIAEIALYGLLNIRGAANEGDCALCAAEANHVHNLPKLLVDFSMSYLISYLEIAIPDYLHESRGVNAVLFNENWNKLRAYVEKWKQDGHA